jgi:hypothetical protein
MAERTPGLDIVDPLPLLSQHVPPPWLLQEYALQPTKLLQMLQHSSAAVERMLPMSFPT